MNVSKELTLQVLAILLVQLLVTPSLLLASVCRVQKPVPECRARQQFFATVSYLLRF